MSQRHSGYERRPHELYETPEWVTLALLAEIGDDICDDEVIWEPACGTGKMVDALKLVVGSSIIGTDIQLGHDFLQANALPHPLCRRIITNPPFLRGQPEAFVRHALHLMKPVHGAVAMLLKVDFDSGSSRRDLFRDCPAWCKKIPLQKRIMWFEPPPREDGKKMGPSENHAWYYWSWRHEGPPTIAYRP